MEGEGWEKGYERKVRFEGGLDIERGGGGEREGDYNIVMEHWKRLGEYTNYLIKYQYDNPSPHKNHTTAS